MKSPEAIRAPKHLLNGAVATNETAGLLAESVKQRK